MLGVSWLLGKSFWTHFTCVFSKFRIVTDHMRIQITLGGKRNFAHATHPRFLVAMSSAMVVERYLCCEIYVAFVAIKPFVCLKMKLPVMFPQFSTCRKRFSANTTFKCCVIRMILNLWKMKTKNIIISWSKNVNTMSNDLQINAYASNEKKTF